MEPLISVCIPVYNCEKSIVQCAQSLFNQTEKRIEYLFMDDASTDNSILLLQQCLEDYPERQDAVKIIRHSQNQGVAAMRMEAMSMATGMYIIHCDADDYVHPEMYQEMLRLAISNNAELVYCDYSIIEGEKKTEVHCPQKISPDEFLRGVINGDLYASLWNKLIKRSVIDLSTIDCPADITMCEDMRILVQIMRGVKTIAHLPKILYYYRREAFSLTKKTYFTPHAIYCRFLNIQLFETLTGHEKYAVEILYLKQRLLLEAVFYGGISNNQWHSLWKYEKWLFFRERRFTWLLKLYFFSACISLPLARFLKRHFSS